MNVLTQDIGNIIHLEHINLNVPDVLLAHRFYIDVLGLTFDSSRDSNVGTTWINAGRTQFHLVAEERAQVIIGTIGVAIPSLENVIQRCMKWTKRRKFTGTRFQYQVIENDITKVTPWRKCALRSQRKIQITGPWGNHFELFEAHNLTMVGIVFVQFDVSNEVLPFMEEIYTKHFQTHVVQSEEGLEITVGGRQRLIFSPPKYHGYNRAIHCSIPLHVEEYGYHVAIYIGDFSGTFTRMEQDNLIYVSDRFRDKADTIEKAKQHRQFRFKDFRNENQTLFELEHEIRSVVHSNFMRPLINRLFPNGGYDGDSFSALAKL